MTLEIEHANFLLRYVAEIVLGIVTLLLMVLKVVGQRTQADAIKASFAVSPAVQNELLKHQIEVATLMRSEFDKFRAEMRVEMGVVHRRVDDLKVKVSANNT